MEAAFEPAPAPAADASPPPRAYEPRAIGSGKPLDRETLIAANAAILVRASA